jgi:hypothetical protein
MIKPQKTCHNLKLLDKKSRHVIYGLHRSAGCLKRLLILH